MPLREELAAPNIRRLAFPLFSHLFNPVSFPLRRGELPHTHPCVFLPAGIAPNITAGPSDSTVIDGMSVILHCETSGAPRPAITWQKGGPAHTCTRRRL